MRRDHGVLEKHFRHWRDKGLLTADQETELRRASDELAQSGASTIVRTALALLGGALLLAGLILLVAENWGAIPHAAKLGSWAVLQCLFLYLAHDLGARFRERTFLSETFAFVAGGWVLAGIALVSQIYHLDSRPPNGVWMWLILVLPMAWLMEQRATAVVLFAALTSGLAMEVESNDSWLHANRLDNPWLFLAVPLLAAGLLSFLPRPATILRSVVGL